jgi:pimeloyl-ACP methyl ester carboxylesterase
VLGEGPIDLVVVNGPASHVELTWEEPATARCLRRLATFSRLVLFDRRGTGLSDPVDQPPTLEQQMDDLHAVMEAVEIERMALMGGADLGLCALFAATFPDEVSELVLTGVSAFGGDVITPEVRSVVLDAVENHWGDGTLVSLFAPSKVGNRAFEEWWGRMQRSALGPRMARRFLELSSQVDLRLPTIRVPTLVIHRIDGQYVRVERGREIASLIPGARFLELPGSDTYGWASDDGWLDDVEEFLTGRRRAGEVDRVLATVLFTDIVGSTDHASTLGDRRWRDLLDDHNEVVRSELERWQTAGSTL